MENKFVLLTIYAIILIKCLLIKMHIYFFLIFNYMFRLIIIFSFVFAILVIFMPEKLIFKSSLLKKKVIYPYTHDFYFRGIR